MSKIKVDQLETLDGTVTVSVADLASASSGVADHGALTGLADDDHPQYHTDARGDARGDARYSQLGHTHTASQISDSTAVGRSVLPAVDAVAARAQPSVRVPATSH